MGLGSFHAVSLELARELAAQQRAQRVQDIDPITARRQKRFLEAQAAASAVTFRQAAMECLGRKRAAWRNPKHAQQWENTLETYAFPFLGHLPVRDVETKHVLRVLDPIWVKKHPTAIRLRERIEAVLDAAKTRGYRQGENPARWRGHLESLLAKPADVRKSKGVRHHPALPYHKMGEFMATLRKQDGLPGTINALSVAYFNSGEFRNLSESTRATYRGIIENFRMLHGDKRVALLQRDHISRIVSAKADTPAGAHNLLRMLRLLMKFAVLHGWRKDDPTLGIKSPKMRAGGFYAWSENDIAVFEANHPIGTRARLALALLLYTAQRRSDVVLMGRQHIRGGVLSIRQQKTGSLVEIPVLPDLRKILDATPSEHLTFLVAAGGKPFTAAGFGNWFREVCEKAALPKACAAHGLRKAASRRLAEAGCTAHQIMAITGHKTLREVTRYTDSVDRRKMAVQAMKKLGKRTSRVKP